MMRYTIARCALLLLLALPLAACRPDAPTPVTDGIADAESPADLVALMGQLLPRVERLSGLDRVGVLRMRRQARDEARRYVELRLDTEMPAERLDGVHRTYAALGLVPDTLNLRALLLDLYTEQILGYYDPRTKTLYVLEGEDAAGLRPLLAHELVHALQDQHVDIDELVSAERGNDRQTAAHAALEGHAMVVMFAVLAEEATRRTIDPVSLPDPALDLADALQQQRDFPVFGRAPAVIQETLLFPYVHGASFVHQIWSAMAPMDRYPAPLDSLLPESTADVLEPVRFLQQRTPPVELQFIAPGAGWSVVYENTLGRLETAIFLETLAGSGARPAADGWAGDRFLLVTDGSADVLHWVSVWQSDAAADSFMRVVGGGRAPAGRSMSAARESVDGLPGVRVTVAPAGLPQPPAPVPASRTEGE